FWVDLTELIRPLSSLSEATLPVLRFPVCHSRESGNPWSNVGPWIPAFAGMTRWGYSPRLLSELLGEGIERRHRAVLHVVFELAALADVLEHVGVFAAHEAQHCRFV